MGDVKRLPGKGCRHHTTGRCLYQEHLNPGYSAEWRCRVLARWEDAYDDFLLRAESFGVSQDAVPDLWGRKFQRMARQVFDCQDYVHSVNGGPPACAHALDGLCRLALPPCPGRCRHFSR
ncbi:hypothetical protein GM415_14570 [Pseudodesulfovibrio cashew]|uniref:Uncharacterized protein n=1 Tax=Pseudodesulfovibrio cashew TaxID=2678688 RepID=A0A6I6JJI6_9BACT|nr:hypothetical protein [Pseudodesulfovibrio cashew]QGY41299.1 hypothetical protein GM415_14570 [Pseudodesulfovibrio cashew]